MTNDDERGEGGKKCRKFDDVICERPLNSSRCIVKDKSCGSKNVAKLYEFMLYIINGILRNSSSTLIFSEKNARNKILLPKF